VLRQAQLWYAGFKKVWMLEVVANALRSPSARLIQNCCKPYQNEKGEWGYCLTVWDAGHYHMISVFHTNEAPTLEEIAEALVSPTRVVNEDGRYANRRGTLGYYATVQSRGH
jgi:hypothetical protein